MASDLHGAGTRVHVARLGHVQNGGRPEALFVYAMLIMYCVYFVAQQLSVLSRIISSWAAVDA